MQAPPEVLFIEDTTAVGVETAHDFVDEAHAVDSAFGEQVFKLLLEGELVDHFVLDYALVEFLVRSGRP